MQAEISLPKAFSVQQENEFFPVQHLMARLNPKLMVVQVATGKHRQGGCTVLWGLAYLDGQSPSKADIQQALEAAGFDFQHGTIHGLDVPDPEVATASS